eukprot:148212_1
MEFMIPVGASSALCILSAVFWSMTCRYDIDDALPASGFFCAICSFITLNIGLLIFYNRSKTDDFVMLYASDKQNNPRLQSDNGPDTTHSDSDEGTTKIGQKVKNGWKKFTSKIGRKKSVEEPPKRAKKKSPKKPADT